MNKSLFARTVVAVLMSALACGSLFAAEAPVFIRGIRPLGMGGAFTAIADDQNAVFYNPAGLPQRQGGLFTLFELPLNVSDDIFNFYSFYNDNKDDLSHFSDLNDPARQIDLINEIDRTISTYRPRLRLGLPNTSYLGKNALFSWGLGVFNQEDIGFKFSKGMLIPTISMWGNADVVAAVPLAHRFEQVPYIPGSLSAGVTLKYINRARIEEMNKSILTFEEFDPALQWGKGFGFDLGALYQPTDRWNFGLQIADAGGTSLKFDAIETTEAGKLPKAGYTDMINPVWTAGAAYIPSEIVYWPGKSFGTGDRLILAADVRDFASSSEPLFEATFWKKLHLGAEFRWGPLSLRGGVNSGYPTAGLGVRIPYLGLRLEYAYWTDELGRYAGQMPESNHQMNIAFSWGDSHGRAFGGAASKNRRTPATAKKTAPVLKEETAPAAEAPAAEQPAVTAATPAGDIPAAAEQALEKKADGNNAAPAADATGSATPAEKAQ